MGFASSSDVEYNPSMSRARKSAILLSLGGLTLTFACAATAFWLSRGYDPARYPGSTLLGGGQLKFSALARGYVSQDGAYETTDRFPEVWHWYANRFDLGANRVVNAMENCMSLGKVEDRFLTRHVIGVTLCDKPDGTMIFINRTLFVYR